MVWVSTWSVLPGTGHQDSWPPVTDLSAPGPGLLCGQPWHRHSTDILPAWGQVGWQIDILFFCPGK